MNRLTFREKEVLRLRAFYTIAECARIFRVTIGRIRSIEAKARAKMRDREQK